MAYPLPCTYCGGDHRRANCRIRANDRRTGRYAASKAVPHTGCLMNAVAVVVAAVVAVLAAVL